MAISESTKLYTGENEGSQVFSFYDVKNHNSIFPNKNESNKLNSINIMEESNRTKISLNDETDVVYRIKFCDSEEEYIFTTGSELLMRNGEYLPVEKIKTGDLCMTFKEILPLQEIGVVKFVVEEKPGEDFYQIHIDGIENLALSNGVYFKLD